MKLRKKLDTFIAEFIASNKNIEKRKALKKAWQEYAKQVYINANCIVDANANTEKRDTIKNFLLAMNEKESNHIPPPLPTQNEEPLDGFFIKFSQDIFKAPIIRPMI